MNRYEQAVAYHHKGFNCCQSVLAAYSDLTGLSQQASFDTAMEIVEEMRGENA